MWMLSVAVALAGPLGPWEGGSASVDTGLWEDPACQQQWPYQLVQLPDRPALFQRWNASRSWGTPGLVDALVEATGVVASRFPDSDPVFVGDLSTRRGGALPPHRYHHDGRSADIGLFATGGVQPRSGFETVWPWQLDLERTWTMISSLLESGRVEHILLDQGHIDQLIGWLGDEGLMTPDELADTFPPRSTPRLWALQGIVRHAPRHRDHLHVRLRCSP